MSMQGVRLFYSFDGLGLGDRLVEEVTEGAGFSTKRGSVGSSQLEVGQGTAVRSRDA